MKAAFKEFPRHPGAGLLATSRAVGDEWPIAREQFHAPLRFLDRDMDRARNLGRIVFYRCFAARVDEHQFCLSSFYFIDTDSADLSFPFSSHFFFPT